MSFRQIARRCQLADNSLEYLVLAADKEICSFWEIPPHHSTRLLFWNRKQNKILQKRGFRDRREYKKKAEREKEKSMANYRALCLSPRLCNRFVGQMKIDSLYLLASPSPNCSGFAIVELMVANVISWKRELSVDKRKCCATWHEPGWRFRCWCEDFSDDVLMRPVVNVKFPIEMLGNKFNKLNSIVDDAGLENCSNCSIKSRRDGEFFEANKTRI